VDPTHLKAQLVRMRGMVSCTSTHEQLRARVAHVQSECNRFRPTTKQHLIALGAHRGAAAQGRRASRVDTGLHQSESTAPDSSLIGRLDPKRIDGHRASAAVTAFGVRLVTRAACRNRLACVGQDLLK
jgi:hypothetical protein